MKDEKRLRENMEEQLTFTKYNLTLWLKKQQFSKDFIRELVQHSTKDGRDYFEELLLKRIDNIEKYKNDLLISFGDQSIEFYKNILNYIEVNNEVQGELKDCVEVIKQRIKTLQYKIDNNIYDIDKQTGKRKRTIIGQ